MAVTRSNFKTIAQMTKMIMKMLLICYQLALAVGVPSNRAKKLLSSI